MTTEHPIPFAALDGKVGVMGVTGSGKTFTAIGLVEQLLEAGRQVIIVDPTGVYNGLRTVFALPIFGGRYGDVEIGEDSGEAVARLIVDQDLSAIVDVSALLKRSHAAARRFMRGFVATLKNAPDRARYIVMDEADEFMPENANGDATQLFGDLKWIVRRGRSAGWRMMMVTQRPQDIAKSVLSQCETMVIHTLTAPQDRKALLEWVKGNADAATAKAVLDSMARLEVGEAWVWSPKHDLLERVRMPANRSEDRSKTPGADDGPRATVGFKAIDLVGIREALAAPAGPAPPIGLSDGALTTVGAAELSDLRGQLAAAHEHIAIIITQRDRWSQIALAYRALIDRAKATLNVPADFAEIPAEGDGAPEGDDGQKMTASVSAVAAKPQRARESESRKPQGVTAGETATLNGIGQSILSNLRLVAPAALTWQQAAQMAGRSPKSGPYFAAKKALLAGADIASDGTFVRAIGDHGAGLDRDHALEIWRKTLVGFAPRMLDVLADGVLRSRDQLGAAMGVSTKSGPWFGGLKALRERGLIEESGPQLRLAQPLPGETA